MISKGQSISSERSGKTAVPQKIVVFSIFRPITFELYHKNVPLQSVFLREALIFGERQGFPFKIRCEPTMARLEI